ncbi:hypothetical protein CGSSpBS457_10929, partial [Streptococcus pneumoniae BS457]
ISNIIKSTLQKIIKFLQYLFRVDKIKKTRKSILGEDKVNSRIIY